MKCPKCGAPSSVLGTRGWLNDTMQQRRRECFNNHRFTTYEIGEQLAKTLRKYAEPNAKTMTRKWGRQTRNRRIADAVVKLNQNIQTVAEQFNLSESSVSLIVKTECPTFNARVAGQRRRWAAK